MYPTRAQPRPSGVSLPTQSTPQNIPTRFARIVQGDIDKVPSVIAGATLQKQVVASSTRLLVKYIGLVKNGRLTLRN